jgi:DNA-binding XRE family transcriptional regulator
MNKLKYYHVKKFSHMKQREFAAFLGISPSYLCELENNIYDPGLKLAFKISQKIKVPIEKLIETDNT